MATFNDIPFEVFTSAILPHLGIRPVCILAQVNKLWKDFADDPIVWKHLYLQNTPSKLRTCHNSGAQTLNVFSKMYLSRWGHVITSGAKVLKKFFPKEKCTCLVEGNIHKTQLLTYGDQLFVLCLFSGPVYNALVYCSQQPEFNQW